MKLRIHDLNLRTIMNILGNLKGPEVSLQSGASMRSRVSDHDLRFDIFLEFVFLMDTIFRIFRNLSIFLATRLRMVNFISTIKV